MAGAKAQPFGVGDIELHIGAGDPSATGVDQHRSAFTQAGGEAAGIAVAYTVVGSNQHHIDRSDQRRNRTCPCRWLRRHNEEPLEHDPGLLGRDEPKLGLADDCSP